MLSRARRLATTEQPGHDHLLDHSSADVAWFTVLPASTNSDTVRARRFDGAHRPRGASTRVTFVTSPTILLTIRRPSVHARHHGVRMTVSDDLELTMD